MMATIRSHAVTRSLIQVLPQQCAKSTNTESLCTTTKRLDKGWINLADDLLDEMFPSRCR